MCFIYDKQKVFILAHQFMAYDVTKDVKASILLAGIGDKVSELMMASSNPDSS